MKKMFGLCCSALGLLSSLFLFAYDVSVENLTMRTLEAQITMKAAISARDDSDWMTIRPGQRIDYGTDIRMVEGVKVRDPNNHDLKVLEEHDDKGMAINVHYLVCSTVEPVGASSEELDRYNGLRQAAMGVSVAPLKPNGEFATYHLFRMPNVLFRPGGIIMSNRTYYEDRTRQFCRDEGSSDIRYNQAYYLMAHNAHTSTKYGYKIDPQQDVKMTELLQLGVRGFMLDPYLYKGDVVLMHGGDKDSLLTLGQNPPKLKERLKEIIDFMQKFDQVVITIILEDYVKDDVAKLDAVLKPYASLILKPSDWDPVAKKAWPTLGWMRSQNKRLIIFKSSKQKSEYVFSDEWRYHIENQYSETSLKGCATERTNSAEIAVLYPRFYVFNFFGPFNANDYNTTKLTYKSTLREVLDYSMKVGLGGKYKGLKPNFIATDFSEWGDGLKIVHNWNLPMCK